MNQDFTYSYLAITFFYTFFPETFRLLLHPIISIFSPSFQAMYRANSGIGNGLQLLCIWDEGQIE